MLNNQAKKDLSNLYKTMKTKRDTLIFWSVLECAGYAEEFKEYLENTKERNETE